MTLEEQLQSMARTDAERQLIRRWMQREPTQPQVADHTGHSAAGDAPNAPDATDTANPPQAAQG